MPTEKAHGIQIMKVCESFALQGVEVELVLPKRFNEIKENPFEYYGVRRNFKIKKLPCLDLIPMDKYIGHLGSWIEGVTFNFFVFPYIFFKKADIVYTREKFSLPLILFKKNLFFEAHTFPKNYFLYSLFLKKLKRIIVITQKLKDLFVGRGINTDKILVAPDGVDLDKFDIRDTQEECRKRLRLPLDRKIVLYTGHLYPWKGVNTLAQASKHLSDETAIYFVGGTKEDIKSFKLQTSGLELNIVGHRPYVEIPYWLKAADVLVLPNSAKEKISKYWTSPIKMFEYMASRRPIVASDLPSIREVLNESNAILVKPDDPAAISRGIERALEDKNLAEKILIKAFNDIREYTWTNRAKKILNFLILR